MTETTITGSQIAAGMTLVAPRDDVEMYVSSAVHLPSGVVSFIYTTDCTDPHAEVFHGQLKSWETIRTVRRSA